jgi:hypothetical protein
MESEIESRAELQEQIRQLKEMMHQIEVGITAAEMLVELGAAKVAILGILDATRGIAKRWQ